ncbi:MAG: ribonuclease Y, partial [Treponema sp.]|nr:ribonuclease Y [Treponema sp.]
MQTIVYIVLPVAGIVLGWTIRWVYARFQLSAAEQKAERVKQDAIKEAEAYRKEAQLQAKEQLIQDRNQQERENRERRKELQTYENRVNKKEELLDQRSLEIDKKEKEFSSLAAQMVKREGELNQKEATLRTELERISGLTQEEAKALIIQNLENEARHDAQAMINKIDQEAQLTAEKKAQEVLVTTIQRLATETTSEIAVATVSLPSDEMKGRIIGREGRNIRALETLTGVDIIIDDTPEAVVISCFDPVRKEIAREALERLITDGRIHPARIEEVVQKVTREVQQKIYEEGEKVLFDLGIHNMGQDAIKALGRLYFRTSYGQNVLTHSKEVAELASMIAAEVGANRDLAKRAALLHDIGKGAETDSDQNHAEV